MADDSAVPPARAPAAAQLEPPAKRTPPPLQPRSHTPKALEGASKSDTKQSSPLAAPGSGHHPVRPAPIRNQSAIAYNGSTPMYTVATDREPLQAPRAKPELDKEELTTKGRKRKRLAKACSACHKNKRRCDGFAPCSNCEFSARPCIYLNAQGEQIPPPRTRDSSATPMNKRVSNENEAPNTPTNGAKTAYISAAAGAERRLSTSNAGAPAAAAGDEWRRDYREREGGDRAVHTPSSDWREGAERRAPFGPIDVVERDLVLQSELLDIFMKRTRPYASMLHLPTFQHRLYLGRVSQFLLDAIYMLAARLSDNQVLIAAYPASVPPHLRGQAFAERCRASVDHIIDIRQHWSEEQLRKDSGSWEETEFVQSALLLSVYYNSIRQPRLGLFYLDVSLSVLRPNSAGALPPPSPLLNLSSNEYYTLAEVRSRTFWLCVVGDICSAASGRPRRVLDHELSHVPLPGPELHWTRYGGMAAGGREPGRRDCIAVGTGNWHTEEGQVGELGHILRILSLFSNIMAIANNGGSGSHEARHLPASHYEQALKAWAIDLPRQLRFDEVNLALSITKIASTVPEIAFSGWAFAYMHAVAECGMFYLQSKHSGAPFAVQRQGQAVDNLTVVIDSLGERGREGPLMCFPIMIVTCWTDHIRATSPTPAQRALEDRLNVWWSEVYREWGWERRETLERGIFPYLETNDPREGADRERPSPLAAPSSAQRAFFDPAGKQGYPSPRLGDPRERDSVSSAASHSVVTPSEFSRDREARDARYPHHPTQLAPLVPRAGSGPLSFGRRSPSPRRHLPAMGGKYDDERERDFNLPSIAGYRSSLVDREYERERDREQDKDTRSREGTHEPRPLAAPRRRSWQGATPASSSGGNAPLLGIDALVSAAEEHRRESLENSSAVAV